MLNFVPGQTVANAFTSALSIFGRLELVARFGDPDATTHVIIDITGFIY